MIGERTNAELAAELKQLATERDEALARERALAEVLHVINSSPGDLTPVFDGLLDRALRLCRAPFGVLFRYDGRAMHLAAMRGSILDEAALEWFRMWVPEPDSAVGRILEGAPFLQLSDVRDTDAYRSGMPSRVKMIDVTGARTAMWVALRHDDRLLGVIVIYRQEVRPFADAEIVLARSFADQAVIAMENARLITETREALEQQTATAEVLQVINSSPGDLMPVFEAMLDKAHALCGAERGTLFLYDGEKMKAAVAHGYPADVVEHLRAGVEVPPHHAPLFSGKHVHVPDLTKDNNATGRVVSGRGGVRTNLLVPLFRNGALLGMISCNRTEVQPFSDKEIALIENFAQQAVIAIENARLLNETREALDQQTATVEVLGVINSSPGDLQPVFDAMVERAVALCEADEALVRISDGKLLHLAAAHGEPDVLEKVRELGPASLGGHSQSGMYAFLDRGENVSHIADVRETAAYRDMPIGRARLDARNVRSWLAVALRKGDQLLGVINVHRHEVRPFSQKQIALLESFAAQAVIAIENARLLTETREALEQQTATAEVLGVINASPGNLAPVFDAMLERAVRLCEADTGHLFRFENGAFFRLASRGVAEDFDELFPPESPVPMDPNSAPARMIATRSVVHVHDTREDESFTVHHTRDEVAAVEAGILTVLFVPLIKEGEVVGHFTMHRMEVRPFSEKQIALVQNFAAQAVVAMENARLITETQEALDQQTATAEVLQVINANPGDLQPVFDVILEKAMALCDVANGDLELYDGDTFRAVATLGLSDAFAEQVRRGYPAGDNPATRPLVAGERLSHIVDMAEADFSKVFTHAPAKDEGHHTLLCVPLRRENALLGMIACARREVRAFSEKEITLLESFAAQAVIAMENARLITETQEALDQQTATAEVLGVINSSPGDIAPVFDAILEKAHALCEVASGSLELFDGHNFHAVATRGLSDAFADMLRRGTPGWDNPLSRPLIDGEPFSQMLDVSKHEFPFPGGKGDGGVGAQTLLGVPLRRDDKLLGIIVSARTEVRPFSDKQIALLQNFAQQVVIAMDNARLLGEIQQRQAELRVTFDNMGDGVVMFDGELRLAAWNRNFQEILDLPDELLESRKTYSEYLHILGERGEFGPGDVEEELSRRLAHADEELRYERTRPDGRVLEVRRNAVAGGGFVLIYSDITERKRSEEEIRAARDAAEAAYRDLQAAQASLVQAQKMAALGQLTAGIAHEIKNPLNFVNNFASLSVELLGELKETTAPALATLDAAARADADDTMDLLTGNLDKIIEHGQRADNIVKSMLEHSRGVSGERRAVDLNNLIEEALNLAYHGARAQEASFNITLERDYDSTLKPVELAPQEMTRVFLNLIGNGFYATTRRAQQNGDDAYRPTLSVATRDAWGGIEVRVRDNGTGIPADIRDKLFQPFFTTKPTGEGTGLGLSISYDIVTQQHGGSIEVASEEGAYTEFTIRLPRQ